MGTMLDRCAGNHARQVRPDALKLVLPAAVLAAEKDKAGDAQRAEILRCWKAATERGPKPQSEGESQHVERTPNG